MAGFMADTSDRSIAIKSTTSKNQNSRGTARPCSRDPKLSYPACRATWRSGKNNRGHRRDPVDEDTFWLHLEYRVCRELAGMAPREVRFFWCDGFIPRRTYPETGRRGLREQPGLFRAPSNGGMGVHSSPSARGARPASAEQVIST